MNELHDICDVFLYIQAKNILRLSMITPETPKTAAIAQKLLKLLLGHGRTLWMDSLYYSPN